MAACRFFVFSGESSRFDSLHFHMIINLFNLSQDNVKRAYRVSIIAVS